MPVALHVALIIVEDIETAKQVTNTARALLAAPELQQPFSERQYEYQHEYRRDSKSKRPASCCFVLFGVTGIYRVGSSYRRSITLRSGFAAREFLCHRRGPLRGSLP